MCVIIDANTFSNVFNAADKDHEEFKPLAKWILTKGKKVVYGGTKYQEELKRAGKYLRIFAELKRAGKIHEHCTQEIDQMESRIENMLAGQGFDDCHLAAIAFCTGCKIVCTSDKGAMRLLRSNTIRPRIRPRNVSRPNIYSDSRSSSILANRNIANCCK